MKRVRNILISGMLSVCMVVASTPVELLAKETVPGQEENGIQDHGLYEIVSFDEMTEWANDYNVPVGTALEELSLPETLTVSYRPYAEKQDGEEETEKNPEDEDNENNPGDDTGDEGNENNPGDDTGDEGNEDNPGGDTGDAGNEDDSGADTGDAGSGDDSGDDAGDAGSGDNPGDDAGDAGSGDNPGGDTGDAGSGDNSGSDAGDAGSEDNSDGDSADRAVAEQKTVEVHMVEYKSRPEFVVKSGTLTPDGQEMHTDEGVEADKEAGEGTGDNAPDSDLDRESEPGADTGAGTDTGADTGTDMGAGADTGNGTSADADTGTDTDTDTSVDTGASTDQDTGTNTDTDADIGTNTDTDKDTEKNPDTENSKDEDYDKSQGIETTVIENIAWMSAPEYDGDTEGCYIFTPVLPEAYVLGEGVALPEIAVTVGEVLPPLTAVDAAPACGTISKDTVWSTTGTLSDGELIVKSGVTLTINNAIGISGEVTIKGGGTIKRGSTEACFSAAVGSELTIENVTVDGQSLNASNPMITAAGKLLLDENCVIQGCINNSYSDRGGAIRATGACDLTVNRATIKNCYSQVGGAIYAESAQALITINDGAVLEECSAEYWGGAIGVQYGTTRVIVNGGTFSNNYTTRPGDGISGGGAIFICAATLTVNGGTFTGNTTPAKGGAIHHCGHAGTTTYIYGGYFEGNTCTNPAYAGSGGVYNSTQVLGNTSMTISGSVQFCGDGVADSGTDGVFLDQKTATFRKIWIDGTLSYPITIFAKASEGYVIAEGKGYTLLKNRDMKKIQFYDTEKEQWYPRLDKEKNQIYLSKTPPYADVYFVYYINNGAQGPVIEDDNNGDEGYPLNATTMVKPADGLTWEGRKFVGWNTQADGKGTSYQPGDTLTITSDINLYAIFEEGNYIDARFYSGGAGRSEVISAEPEKDGGSVTIKAPELQDMDGWTKVGWDESKGGYRGAIRPDASLTISKDTSYYGVYERTVTLSYDANGGEDAPAGRTGGCLANVHDEITYDMQEFTVAAGITASDPGWEFVGWNTKQDGTGDSYSEGDKIKIAEDTTLYATFVKPPYATFYSGQAGEYEKRGTNVITGKVLAPHLKPKSGWEETGWDEAAAGHEGTIRPDSELTLAGDTVYYGVYEKTVTLSYRVLNNEYGVENIPADSTQTRKAKVCEKEIRYAPESDTPDAFVFDIASDLSADQYEFLGWNTRTDAKGDFYSANDARRNKITIMEDTVLYGIFKLTPSATFFSGPDGDYVTVSSTMIDGDVAGTHVGTLTAPALKELEGWDPVGWSRSETGYGESVEVEGGQDITISEDAIYYGVYKKKVDLSYDANGWLDAFFDKQSRLRYANVHGGITYTSAAFAVGNDIRRNGYTFLGWSLVRDADSSAAAGCYKPEDTITLEDSATLYAQMVDDIAPVLGEAVYNDGYRDVKDWIVRKKDLVITVPVTEEGSGVNKIVYTFTPESGEPFTGEALMEDAGEPGQKHQSAAVWLEVGSGADAVSSADIRNGKAGRAGASGGEVVTTDGQIQAKITVSEDYKGTISLMCKDNAENESPLKLLSAQGGGVIVEDNAPQISFLHKGSKNGRAVVEVTVYDNADQDSNRHITGGIAAVSYQIDHRQAQSVTDKGFAEGIVETCSFEVEVSGAGGHTIKVTAVDNAGNESSLSTSVSIGENKKETTVIETYAQPEGESSASRPPAEVREPELPVEKDPREPKTGDSFPSVAVYATIAMISGLLYVLLYFIAEQSGMTESDKNAVVARLIAWAKRGGKLRRYAALAVVFCVLVYYHSIGKSSADDLEMLV